MTLLTIPITTDFKRMSDLISYVSTEFGRWRNKLPRPHQSMKWVFTLQSVSRTEVVYRAFEIVKEKYGDPIN